MKILLVIPDGYCLLERDSSTGRDWYAFQDRLIEGRGSVILTYAACTEVEKRKADPDYPIERQRKLIQELVARNP